MADVRCVIDDGVRHKGSLGRINRREKVQRLERDIVVFWNERKVIHGASTKFVPSALQIIVHVESCVSRKRITMERVPARCRREIPRFDRSQAVDRRSAIGDIERFAVDKIVLWIAVIDDIRALV